MSDQDSDILIEALTAGLRASGELTFSLKGPIKVPMTINGTYKTKPLNGDEEFILDSMRVGARKQIIFVMKPTDARPYDFAEFDERVAFDAFQTFEEQTPLQDRVLGWLGKDGVSWKQAKEDFIVETLAAREAERSREETGKYADNEAWGMF